MKYLRLFEEHRLYDRLPDDLPIENKGKIEKQLEYFFSNMYD